MKTRDIFCTNEQEITEHEVSIDNNGEFLLTCKCDEFIKLPGDLNKAEINQAIKENEKENEGKVTLEFLTKINEEKLKNI